MSLPSPWTSAATSPVVATTEVYSSSPPPTLQEIMDEELARQIYEDDCRAIEAELTNDTATDLFSDLESKTSDRALFSADSFSDDDEVEEKAYASTSTAKLAAVGLTTPSATKSKQRFDRSIPVEGTELGLNSIRESFRRWGKDERHGHTGSRVEASKFATQDAVLDQRTTLLLQKLINRGDLDEVHGCLQSGKEANVYFAIGTDQETFRQRHYAVKIFKTTLNAFTNRKDYITGDHRFDLAFQKKDRRRQIHEWSEKEFRNLSRATKWVHAPQPVLVKDHIVVMDFIGNTSEGLPAPTLKEVVASMTPSQRIHAYADLLCATRALFRSAKLVHGDLSEYNVLYHKQKCWLIDFGQAMDQTHPEFLSFLQRDLANVLRFFEKHGIADAAEAEEDATPGLLSVEEAFAWVTAVRESEADAVLAMYPQLKHLLASKL